MMITEPGKEWTEVSVNVRRVCSPLLEVLLRTNKSLTRPAAVHARVSLPLGSGVKISNPVIPGASYWVVKPR